MKSRLTRLPDRSRLGSGTVVRTSRPRTTPHNPARRISRSSACTGPPAASAMSTPAQHERRSYVTTATNHHEGIDLHERRKSATTQTTPRRSLAPRSDVNDQTHHNDNGEAQQRQGLPRLQTRIRR
jgi:hypothetical protein